MSDDDVRVSSTLYNLAGPEEGRVDYLKSLLIGAVTQEVPSISEAITLGYLRGPAIRYRSFLHWAQNNTDFQTTFGETSGTIGLAPSVDRTIVKTAVNDTLTGMEVDTIDRAEVNQGKVRFWVLRYAAENDPDLPVPRPNPPYSGDDTYTYDEGTNEVVLTRSSGDQTFNPSSPAFDPEALYLYVKYTPCVPYAEAAIDYGSTDVLVEEVDPDPDFSSPWLRMDDCTTGVEEATVTAHDELDRTYSDARPPVHVDYTPFDTDVSEPTKYDHFISNSAPAEDIDGSQYSIRTHKEFWVTYVVDTRDVELSNTDTDIGGGVIRTDIITRTEEYLRRVREVRISTQKITWKTLLSPRWFIYLYESGTPALDAEMEAEAPGEAEGFYPPIPFRIDNETVGTLQQTATRWRIHIGALDFTWDEDKYDMLFDVDERDVQVSHYDGSDPSKPAHWVSVKWISSPIANQHYVESRPKDDDSTISGVEGRDEVDFDIEVDYPLYRVFTDTTDTHPGFYRVRVQAAVPTSPYDNEWEVLSGPTQFLERPTPSDYGYNPDMADVYAVARKAFKKAYGSKYDTVLESVLENDSLGNIDHAYAVFGVSFNVQENSCRKYIYRMLEHMFEGAPGGEDEAPDFMEQYTAANSSWDVWDDWYNLTHDEDGEQITEWTDDTGTHHAEPPPEPVRVELPTIPWKTLTVESIVDGESNYKNTIKWAFINRTTGSGLLTKTAEEGGLPADAGDLWWSIEADPFDGWDTPDEYLLLNNVVTLNWQKSATHWEKLTVSGMTHTNHIYGDHSITHTAKESVNWTRKTYSIDEEGVEIVTDTMEYQESPFIIPMHGQVYRDMPMKDATQMATACTFLVFNSYSIVEEPWYDSTWFAVIKMIVIIVFTIAAIILLPGAGLGIAGSTIEGLAIGAGVGATTALVIGALADILVGTALAYFASWLAVEIFGKKVGGVVGAILGLALGTFAAGGTEATEKLFSTAEGWTSITMALGNGASVAMQIQAEEIMRETAKLMEKSSADLAKLQKQFNEEFGKNRIDPNLVSQYINELLEKPGVFLERTLMTGSDIVEATHAQVDDFVENRLRLVLP